LAVWCACILLLAARAEEPAKPDAAKEIEKALERKISFHFVDTPLNEALSFLRSVAKVNFVLDAAIGKKHNPQVNLQVADMPLSQALGWVCKLTECKWEIADNAVHIAVQAAVVGKQGKGKQAEDAEPQPPPPQPPEHPAQSRKLRVRFADGTEVEAEGALLDEQPDLARKLLDRALDPGRDGILAYRVGDANEAATLTKRIAQFAPKAKTEYDEGNELLIVTGDEPATLRRAASLMRKLGRYDVEVEPAAAAEEQGPAEEDKNKIPEPQQLEQPPRLPADDPVKPTVF
jgi:hypothetical protein